MRPVDAPGQYRRYSNAGYALAARLVEQHAEMPFRDYLRSSVLDPLGMDASLGLAPEDAARTAVVRQPGVWSDGQQFFNSPAFRAAELAESGGYATAIGYASFLRCLLDGGRAPGRALLASETVEDMLSTQFGELPGGVEGVTLWDACPWGLGLDVRGTREPHWTGDSLSPSANTHFGSSGTLAWIDRARGVGPGRAREPRLVLGVVDGRGRLGRSDGRRARALQPLVRAGDPSGMRNICAGQPCTSTTSARRKPRSSYQRTSRGACAQQSVRRTCAPAVRARAVASSTSSAPIPRPACVRALTIASM